MINETLKGGVLFVVPGGGAGNFIVDQTNIRDSRLGEGEIISVGIVTELVERGAVVVVKSQREVRGG